MSSALANTDADWALRDGLQRAVVGTTSSAEFDDRVLHGVRRPATGRETFFAQFRIIVPTAAFATCVMLTIINAALSPSGAPQVMSLSQSNGGQIIDVDQLMREIDNGKARGTLCFELPVTARLSSSVSYSLTDVDRNRHPQVNPRIA